MLRKLVSSADVLHQNFVRGAAERMGFGEDDVRRIRPDIIYSSLNVHAEGGFRTFYRGHEELGQAVTGIQERYGDQPEARDACRLDPVRLRDGTSVRVRHPARALPSLTNRRRPACKRLTVRHGDLLSDSIHADLRGPERDEPRGLYAKGWNAQNRFYKASDGWFYLAAPGPDGRSRLMRVAGVAPESANLESALAARFASAPAAHWVEQLNETGIGAHVAANFSDVLNDETAERRKLVVRWNEKGQEAQSLGIVARLSLTQPNTGNPAPLGAHSRELLAETGLADRFADLLAKGVVAEPAGR